MTGQTMLAAVAMDDEANPTRSSLRQLLQQLMPTDTELRSLCIELAMLRAELAAARAKKE